MGEKKNGFSTSYVTDLYDAQSKLVQEEITGSNVMLVSENGGPVYYQIMNSKRKSDKNITEDTIFPIASMTKPITIVAIMILVEKGLIDVNAPVKYYLPMFDKLKVKRKISTEITKNELLVHHLMSHRSGFSYNYRVNSGSPLPSQNQFRDLKEFVNVAARTPVEFEPGSSFVYGINQAILGRLIEVVSNEPFEVFLQNNIFRPLLMNTTGFSLLDEQRKHLQSNFLSPLSYDIIHDGPLQVIRRYVYRKKMLAMSQLCNFNPQNRAHFGGEGLLSTMNDYANFCEMLTCNGEFKGQRILKASSIETITKSHTQDFDEKSALFNWPPGYDVGLSVFVKNKSKTEKTKAPVGIFGWSGIQNTHFWIDQENKLFGLFMSRSLDFDWNIPILLREALYGTNDDLF